MDGLERSCSYPFLLVVLYQFSFLMIIEYTAKVSALEVANKWSHLE